MFKHQQVAANPEMLASREGMAPLAQLSAGGSLRADPCISPLNGNYGGACPSFFEVGGDEALLDDSVRVHRKALEAGVSALARSFPGCSICSRSPPGRCPRRISHSSAPVCSCALSRRTQWDDSVPLRDRDVVQVSAAR